MADSTHTFSSGSGHRMRAIELSYGEMTTFSSGGIMSKQTKTDLRKQHGYCLTCPLVPIHLVDIRRSRMNPLWISKKLRSSEGECVDGKCLKCHPEIDSQRGKPPAITSPSSFRSAQSAQSFASSISSCSMSSLESRETRTIGPVDQIGVGPRNSRAISPGSHNQPEQDGLPQRIRIAPRHTISRSRRNTEAVGSRRTSQEATPLSTYRSASCETENSGHKGRETARAGNSSSATTNSSRLPPRDLNHHADPSIPICSSSTEVDHGHGTFQSKSEGANSPSFHVQTIPALSIATQVPMTLGTTMQSLTTMLNVIKASGCVSTMTACLISTMEAHPSDEQVQLLCLTTVADEFDDVVFDSTVFVAANGDERVMQALKKFPTSLEVQEVGCYTLSVLAVNERNRPELIRRGACSHLEKSLSHHLGDTSLVLSVFTALRILSTEAEGRRILQDLSLSKTAVAAMQCNVMSASIQRDGCALLSNMAVDSVNKQVSTISKSDISAIVNAMQCHNNDESVMASACFALKNFTYSEANIRSMNQTEAICNALDMARKFDSVFISAEQTLEKIQISRAQDESLEEQELKALKAMVAEQSDDPAVMVGVLGILKACKWSGSVVTMCFKILKSLALTSEPHKQRLLSSITHDELSTFTEDFQSVDDIQTEAAILCGLVLEAGRSVAQACRG